MFHLWASKMTPLKSTAYPQCLVKKHRKGSTSLEEQSKSSEQYFQTSGQTKIYKAATIKLVHLF